jgi:hypothetical protein
MVTDNVFLVLSVSVLFGGSACFLISKLILVLLKVVCPSWIGLGEKGINDSLEITTRTKLVPRRLSAYSKKKPYSISKVESKLLTAAIFFAGIFLFGLLNNTQPTTSSSLGSFIKVSPKLPPCMDGVRMEFWPVWGRSGNDNIISREKIFGQRIVSNDPTLEAIPEELWPLWARTGNEWLIKHRMPLFRNHT